MVAVCSKGDGVEVDNGNVTMTKSLRKRMAVACSEAGVKVVACSWAGIEDARWRRQRNGF
jgi:hypothetical protein